MYMAERVDIICSLMAEEVDRGYSNVWSEYDFYFIE